MDTVLIPDFETFDAAYAVRTLQKRGGCSFPLLKKEAAQWFACQAHMYTFMSREIYVPSSGVRQEMTACDAFPRESPFFSLRSLVQRYLENEFNALKEYPFKTPLVFNELWLQRYEVGSLGITPHRDPAKYRNLTCIIVLEGRGRFCLCDDRSGSNPYELKSTPGDTILISALGFRGFSERPFHFLDTIRDLRISFGLQQV